MRKKLLLFVSIAILGLGSFTNEVLSQNLVVNGDFETGTLDSWTNLANDGGSAVYTINETNPAEGTYSMSAQVDTLGEKAWSVQSMTNSFDVVAGKTYNVEYWAKSDAADSKFKVVAQGGGDYHGQEVTLTQEWAKYTFEFTAENTSSAAMQFKFQYKTLDTYHIDSVAVWDPAGNNNTASANLLTNWGFEEDLTAEGAIPEWNNLIGGGAAATYSLETTGSPEGDNHMKVVVDTLGENGWSVQSFSPTFTAIKDSTYQVAWLAKSSVEGAELNVIFQDQSGQQYGGKKTLTTEWVEYRKQWTAGESGEAYLKMWWMNVGEYQIDSVVVEDPTFVPGLETQTIEFPAIDDKFTTADPFDITATASSGLPVTLEITGPATLDGNTVTLTGDPGIVTIIASQEGDDMYNPATEVERSFEVTIEGWVYEQTLETDVKFSLGTITVDGIANEPEWSAVEPDTADTYYNDNNNDPDYFTTDIASEDLSGWFKLLWTESGIYVYADITDDVIHTDSADIHANGGAHQYDNLEVYFQVPLENWTEDLKESNGYDKGTFQMRANIGVGDLWSGRSPYATDGGQGWTSTALDGFYEYAFASKEGGVTFEGFYPFDNLFGGSNAALPNRLGEERSILFEFAYGDSDGEGTGGVRAGGIVWNTIPDILNSYSDLAAQNRKQFGKINLTSVIAEEGTSVEYNAINVKVYPTVFNDHIMIQTEKKVVDVRLYNSLGMEMLHVQDPNGIEYINQLEGLNTGFYFLKMKSGNKIRTAKIIKK